jgi:DHA1 family tetracycline resistance protein-like MFS transporter
LPVFYAGRIKRQTDIPTFFRLMPMDDSTAPNNSSTGHRSTLLIIFLVVFVDLLGFGIVLPLLPLYAVDFLQPLLPGEDQRPVRGMILGLLMSSFSAMQFLFAPMWGRVSDRIGRRPILLLGLSGSVIFYTLFGVASEIGEAGWLRTGLTLLFLARLGAGVAGATISTAQAVIADITTSESRSRGMAMIGAAFGVGFTFGPLLGFASLFVPAKGAPGFVAAALSLTALLLAIRLLPETFRPGKERKRRLFDWEGLQTAWRIPSVGLLILIFFLATYAFGSLESTLALINKLLLQPLADLHEELTTEAAKATEKKNFLIFAYVGFVLVFANMGYRRLVRPKLEVKFLQIGSIFMALGLAGAVIILLLRDPEHTSGSILVLGFFAMTLAVIGFACITPSVQALISLRTDASRQGEILGVNQSGAALARILGPFVGLSLFDLSKDHVLPFAFGACLTLLVFLLTTRIRQD